MDQDQSKKGSPPYCNTGAQNTYRDGLRACLDWVQFTLLNVPTPHDVVDILGLDFNDFYECKSGGNGYASQIRFGHISIFYDGKENMGIHVQMTGQGCREYETYNTYTWNHLFALLLNFDVNFTRIDLAIDDFKGYFKISTLRRKIKDKCVRSLFRDAMEIKKTHLSDGSNKGETIYFGSGQSRIQVRFYDKYIERLEAGKEFPDDITFWNRTEIQSRDERAEAIAIMIANNYQEIGTIATGILKRYIKFLNKGKDSNKARWKIANFWDKFLGDVQPLQLSLVAPDKTIEKTANWINGSVNPSMAMLYVAFGEDMEMFNEMLIDGLSRLDKTHLERINRFRNDHRQQVLSLSQFKDQMTDRLKKIQKNSYKNFIAKQNQKKSSLHE